MAASRASELRVAIVTGGSRGIVRCVVQRLAGDGLSVAVGHGSNHAEAAAVDAAGLMSLAPAARLRPRRPGPDALHQHPRHLRRRPAGRPPHPPGGAIINFSSSVLGRVLPVRTGYAANKAAAEAMTFILAHELRGGTSPSTPSPFARPPPTCSSKKRRGTAHPPCQRRPAAAARHPGRHCPGRRVPRQPRRALDQWPDHPRQRRNQLAQKRTEDEAEHRHHRRLQRYRRAH